MRTKRLKSGISVFMAAIMSMVMLTACGGGGGSSGGGTPVKPVTYSSTKTCAWKKRQKEEPLYMEYWQEGYEDNLTKQGSLYRDSYTDLYTKNKLESIVVQNDKKYYSIYEKNTTVYAEIVKQATRGGAVIPEGKTVYIDMMRYMSSFGVGDLTENSEEINDDQWNISIGTYEGRYAEIFVPKNNPYNRTYIYVYDKGDMPIMHVFVQNGDKKVMHYNKFEFNSPLFNASRLKLEYYDAMDITEAYIKGGSYGSIS